MTAFARWTGYGSSIELDGGAPACYDNILYLPVGNGIQQAVINDSILTISGMSWSARKYRSYTSYFRDKLAVLHRLALTKRILVLVDDVKDIRLRELTALLTIPADILISSRMTEKAFDGLPKALRPRPLFLIEMPKEELADMAKLIRPNLSEEKRVQYSIICQKLHGHTLALKLWLKSDGVMPAVGTEGEVSFLPQRLERGARQLLMALSVLPPEGVPRIWAEQVCGIGKELSERLAEHSLVQLNAGQDGQQWISLHPVIAEEVRRTLRPNIKSCRHLMENVAKDVGNAWNESKEDMLLRLPAVHSMLTAFPECPAWMAPSLDKLFTYLWVMEDFKRAEQGYLKLFASVLRVQGEPSQTVGWMALRVGAVYHNSLRFEEAEVWYERGLQNLRSCQSRDTDYWWQRMEACGKCTRGPLHRGEADRVLELLNEAEAVYLQAPNTARSDRLLLTEAYHSRRRASFCLQQGRMEEAQFYRRRMHEEMELYFSRCGADGPKQLDLRETDIEFEQALGNLETAVHLLEISLCGYALYRGPEHEDTLHCKEHMAETLCRMEDQAGAAARFESTGGSPRARELYLQVAAGLRRHYPYESAWLTRVEERIREL